MGAGSLVGGHALFNRTITGQKFTGIFNGVFAMIWEPMMKKTHNARMQLRRAYLELQGPSDASGLRNVPAASNSGFPTE